MNTRKSKKNSQLPAGLQGLLQNLHTPSENLDQSSSAHGNSTLAEASQHDVDKLLDRAGIRGAAAKERSKRAKDLVNAKTKKRNKSDLLEGQESLFYQRKGKHHSGTSTNSVICGAAASNLNDVKYGSSLVKDDISATRDVPDESKVAREDPTTNESSMDVDVISQNVLESPKGAAHVDENALEDGLEWENGTTIVAGSDQDDGGPWSGDITIEIDMGTDETTKTKRRIIKRATAKDKEFAELVHKVHLLCLIARGRLVDAECNDTLLQASLLSTLPPNIKLRDTERVSLSELEAIVKWFHKTFKISTSKTSATTTESNENLNVQLLAAIQRQEGSSEEIAALAVSLLRALGLSVRFVAVLDVVSLKPDTVTLEASADWDGSSSDLAFNAHNTFSQQYRSTKTAVQMAQLFANCVPPRALLSSNINHAKPVKEEKPGNITTEKQKAIQAKEIESKDATCFSGTQETVTQKKRKCDLEFEMQLQMAMDATRATSCTQNASEPAKGSLKEMGNTEIGGNRISSKAHSSLKNKESTSLTTERGAVWSRKMGPMLHWAEVYCGGVDGGRWVHVDAGHGILDGAAMVEGAATSCKISLRYVLAFAGNGAKDVTRRYVTLWSAIAPLRVSSDWWAATLAPLKELESVATSGSSFPREEMNKSPLTSSNKENIKHELANADDGMPGSSSISREFVDNSLPNNRASLEDMELDIRAFTEPLPKNQQAYKNHHLYVLEKWLTKYQALYPRGPILGYCAGNPVYPRTCVQNLHTAQRWLREGFKVRDGEVPAKIVKNPRAAKGSDAPVDTMDGSSNEGSDMALFGKWQTDPWQPQAAVGGIVPKNERGNVEMWSEKCLPPGTVHIKLPRILHVAKKLEIDFAEAMVGYEVRNRKSVPVFEGIIVCQEYEDILLEAYAEEEYRRSLEAEKRREALAISRWSQLLRAMVTRQRLQAAYEKTHEAISTNMLVENDEQEPIPSLTAQDKDDSTHEHVFPADKQNYDEATGIRTKVCPCGFVLTVEEM